MKLTPNIKVFIPGNLYPGSVKCKIINKDKDLIKRNTTRNCFCCVCVYSSVTFPLVCTVLYMYVLTLFNVEPTLVSSSIHVYLCVHLCTQLYRIQLYIHYIHVQYQYTKERKCMCVDIHVVYMYVCVHIYTGYIHVADEFISVT